MNNRLEFYLEKVQSQREVQNEGITSFVSGLIDAIPGLSGLGPFITAYGVKRLADIGFKVPAFGSREVKSEKGSSSKSGKISSKITGDSPEEKLKKIKDLNDKMTNSIAGTVLKDPTYYLQYILLEYFIYSLPDNDRADLIIENNINSSANSNVFRSTNSSELFRKLDSGSLPVFIKKDRENFPNTISISNFYKQKKLENILDKIDTDSSISQEIINNLINNIVNGSGVRKKDNLNLSELDRVFDNTDLSYDKIKEI